jgi:DNA-binding HxlR family transcriptional regulator
MFESGKRGNAAKKAYEIAYALFRISTKISESSIKEKIESHAIDLLISVNSEEYGNAAKSIAAIDALVKFAVDLNFISLPNGDVLLREISAMHEVVIECLDKSDDVDVSKFFSKPKDPIVKDVTSLSSSIVHSRQATIVHEAGVPSPSSSVIPMARGERNRTEAGIQGEKKLDTVFSSTASATNQRNDSKEENSKIQSGNPAIAIRSGNRQIAILDKIRQSGNCKLKEIQDILPDCSERTIRYDLEELIERDLIERIGAGGPAVSYRIRQIA